MNSLDAGCFATSLMPKSTIKSINVSKGVRITDIISFDFESVTADPFWNAGYEKEPRMHKIHAYPAKFPSFIASNAFKYAQKNFVPPKYVADFFCGCGTVALEAKKNNIDFWGCDINPVATMISKVKSHKYQLGRLIKYYSSIIEKVASSDIYIDYEKANERIKYWFDADHYSELFRLREAIQISTPKNSFYRLFFLCAFSNILKATSRWLTKSIKPQFDPSKIPSGVMESFKHQYEFMINSIREIGSFGQSGMKIITGNILDPSIKKPKVDMVLSSPPYVTSYDYAGIHQLSLLWLGYAEDYRKLRIGSIGSKHQHSDFKENIKKLNGIGANIVEAIMKKNKSLARDIAQYYVDMQNVTYTSYNVLNEPGIVLFVIGNTEYKGVKIDNVRHLALSMINSGFKNIRVTKRKISSKLITPYRDVRGRFTKDSSQRHVYNEEFILIGMK